MSDPRMPWRELIALIPALVFCPARAAQSQAPEKLALLVGIDRYAPGTPASFPRLTGCVRDVAAVRAVLEERFGFPAGEIRVLEDDAATHAGIVRAFWEHLIERAGPDTEVVFWFSGHGSRVPDRSGTAAAELTGKDSTFVAYDSRANGEDGAFDVSDDEVHSLLAALTAKTTRVTVVTDSCHSGGSTRGGVDPAATRIRGVGDGARPVDRERLLESFWPKDVPLLDDGDPGMLAQPGYVHIAACSPVQLAQEIDVEDDDGRRLSQGALTFLLLQRLLEAQPHVSYRRLADDVAVRLSTRCPAQTVWSEGALSRELFGARFEPRPSGFRARVETATGKAGDRPAEAPADLRVEAGTLHGLRPGSLLALYSGEALVGRARVLRTASVSAVARWLEPVPSEIREGALRAIEETRPAREEPLSLWVQDPEVALLLAKSQRVRIVGSDPADIGDAEYQLRAGADGRLALLGPGGVRIWRDRGAGSGAESALSERLEREFREELRYRALVGLAEESGSVAISARFVAPSPKDLEEFRGSSGYQRLFAAEPHVESQGHGSAAGAVYQAVGTTDPEHELSLALLEIENLATSAVHVAVLSVTEDRQRNALWPREGEQDHVLKPGERVRVPVNVVSSSNWTEARPMRDRYLVLATLEAADFTPLARELPRGEDETRGSPPPLRMPPILALALERPQTRGVHNASTDRSSFGLVVVDLLVGPPESK